MSDVLSEFVVDCCTLQHVVCTDHCAITVTLNLDQLPMTHNIEGQKAKHINWKFEDVGFKRLFYQRLDSMLDAAPAGLQQVHRDVDANRHIDLFMSNATFMSNAIHKKPSQFNVSGWNERAKEFNAQYREAVSHWNIAGRPRSGLLAELKCRARAAFRHEMKFLRENDDQLRSQSMLSKLQRGECNDFWKEIKELNPKKESLILTVG